MRKISIVASALFSLLLCCGKGFAQNRFPPINVYTGDPTGVACTIPNSIVQSSTTGALYSCVGGVYVTPASGVGAVTGTAPVVATPSGSTVNISLPTIATPGNAYALSVVGPQNTVAISSGAENVYPGLTPLPDGNWLSVYIEGGQAYSKISFDGGITWPQTATLPTPPGGEGYAYVHAATLQNQKVALNGAFQTLNSSGNPFYSLGTIDNPINAYNISANSISTAIDSAGNTLVAAYNSGQLLVVSPTGSVLHTITVGTHPYFVAVVPVGVTGAGNIWVANSGSNTCTVLNSSYTAISGSPFACGVSPLAIAFDASGNAWIGDEGPIGSGGTATATLSGGSTGTVTGYTHTAGGSGYTIAPMMLFTGPANLAGNIVTQTAAALGTVSAGALIDGSISSAVQFTAVPTVRVIGQGEVTELNHAGTPVGASPFTFGGIELNTIAVVTSGNVLVGYGQSANSASGVAVLNSSGVYQSTLFNSNNRPQAFAFDTSTDVWEVGLSGGVVGWTNAGTLLSTFQTNGISTGLSIDGSNDFWISKLTTGNVLRYSSAGAPLGQLTVGAQPYYTTVDASGNLWVPSLGTNNLYKVNTTVDIDSITFPTPTVINIAGQCCAYSSGPVVPTGTNSIAMPVWYGSGGTNQPNYPLTAGLITSADLGTSWSAFTAVGTPTNDPTQPSLGYDEGALQFYPTTGDLAYILRHENYTAGGDPYGTYASSLLKSGSSSWPVPQDVITGCGYGTMTSYAGEPSLALAPTGQLMLAARCQEPGQTAVLNANANIHAGGMSLDEGQHFSPMVPLAPATQYDDGYDAIAFNTVTGAIGSLQASTDALRYVNLTQFGIYTPTGINPSIAQPTPAPLNATSAEVTGISDVNWAAGSSSTGQDYVSSEVNATFQASETCHAFGVGQLGYAMARLCAYNTSPANVVAGFKRYVQTGTSTNALGDTLDTSGNYTPQGNYKNAAGNVVIPATASAYFGSSTGSPLLCSGTPTAGKYCDGASGVWTALTGVGTWNPVPTSLTHTGTAPTITGTYKVVGAITYYQIKIVPGTSTTSATGTTWFTPPSVPTAQVACGVIDSDLAQSFVGQCTTFIVTGSTWGIFTPTWTTNTATVYISGWYW